MPYHIDPKLIIDGTLYTLIAFSALTWTMIVFKIWQFDKNRYYNRRFNKAFWQATGLATAQSLPKTVSRGSQARLAKIGFTWLDSSRHASANHLKYQGEPMALLEHVLLDATKKEARTMEFGLTLLASIGSTAPFVGLFGTVLGIMHAMHEITASGSTSLNVVAGPIGDALIATAIGIAVAVPAVLAYNFFLRWARHQRTDLENFVAGFMRIAFSTDAQIKE